MSKKVITLQNDIEADGVSAKAGDRVLLKNLPSKDSLREEITNICLNNGGVSKPMVDKLYKLFTSHIEEAERRVRKRTRAKLECGWCRKPLDFQYHKGCWTEAVEQLKSKQENK